MHFPIRSPSASKQYDYPPPSSRTTALNASFEAHLKGHSTPEEAALRITTNDPSTPSDDFESVAFTIWTLAIRAAEESPTHHDPVIALLQAIKSLPDALDSDGQPALLDDGKIWSDLPCFGWEMRDHWNYFEPPADDPDRASMHQGWQNLNGFAAKLTASRCRDFLMYGLWGLREALEEGHEDVTDLDGHVPAAAEWIVHAGREIFESRDGIEPSAHGGDPYRPGGLWDHEGTHGFCRERWDFWRERFGWVGGVGEVSEETRRCAREAVALMEEIEGAEGV